MLTFPSIDRQGQLLLNSTPCLILSTSSLAWIPQQQQHLNLHQQERGSAAAAPAARMRRVQQAMLHVPSNISCDYVSCVSFFFQLASPPGFHVTYISKGNLVSLYIKNKIPTNTTTGDDDRNDNDQQLAVLLVSFIRRSRRSSGGRS